MIAVNIAMSLVLNGIASIPANHVVFSEVLPIPNSNQVYFIEFYNPTNSSIDLSNWLVQTPEQTLLLPEDTVIASYSFLLLGEVSEVWPASWVQPDYWYNFVGISGTSTGLKLINAVGNVVDAVGWGSPPIGYYEGQPFTIPTVSKSLERRSGLQHHENGGNGRDTENNLEDFYQRNIPQPQNTESPPERPSSGLEATGLGMIKAIYGSNP